MKILRLKANEKFINSSYIYSKSMKTFNFLRNKLYRDFSTIEMLYRVLTDHYIEYNYIEIKRNRFQINKKPWSLLWHHRIPSVVGRAYRNSLFSFRC